MEVTKLNGTVKKINIKKTETERKRMPCQSEENNDVTKGK